MPHKLGLRETTLIRVRIVELLMWRGLSDAEIGKRVFWTAHTVKILRARARKQGKWSGPNERSYKGY